MPKKANVRIVARGRGLNTNFGIHFGTFLSPGIAARITLTRRKIKVMIFLAYRKEGRILREVVESRCKKTSRGQGPGKRREYPRSIP